jgi:hypothetical protein
MNCSLIGILCEIILKGEMLTLAVDVKIDVAYFSHSLV